MTPVSPDDMTVVCVTYNSMAMLDTMAGTLAQFRHVVIIDNASSDDTVALIRTRVPHARVIANTCNTGFGAANNTAIAQVGTPYALLLNPDCVIAPDDVQRLLECMQHFPRAGLAGPQNWRDEASAQISYRDAFYKPSDNGYRVPAQVLSTDWIPGCCMLVKVDAFQAIGGFDPAFFLYYEDDDLCLRLRQAGYECLLEPAAKALHVGGASSTPSLRTEFIKRFHYARSRQLAIRRYVGAAAARVHLAKLLSAALPAMLLYTLLLRPRDVVKWAGWGYAALSMALSLDVMPGRSCKRTATDSAG